MKRVKVLIEWASDGGIWAVMVGDNFSGRGETIEAAVAELKEGVAFFIETAKENGFPYDKKLDGDYEIEIEYDAESALQYAGEFMTDEGLAKLTGVGRVQINKYRNGKVKPRADQQRKIIDGLHKFATAFSAIVL